MRILLTIFALSLLFLDLQAVSFDQAAEEIVEAGVFLNRFGICPATSGNLSTRLEARFVVVTASGKPKGELTTEWKCTGWHEKTFSRNPSSHRYLCFVQRCGSSPAYSLFKWHSTHTAHVIREDAGDRRV